jgi:hypothetical protein
VLGKEWDVPIVWWTGWTDVVEGVCVCVCVCVMLREDSRTRKGDEDVHGWDSKANVCSFVNQWRRCSTTRAEQAWCMAIGALESCSATES